MIVLAIDTAGADCAAALYESDGDIVLATVVETIGRGHAERLMAVIDEALAAARLSLQDVGRIAVTIGPGSFTGIRVGVAAARGFALALGVEATGVSTLAVLAQQHLEKFPGRPVIAAMDAKRSEIYAQAFGSDGLPLGEAAAIALDEMRELARVFDAAVTGSAAALMSGAPEAGEPDSFPIALVARLGAKAEAGGGKPRPLYLRGPDAKCQAGFAIARM